MMGHVVDCRLKSVGFLHSATLLYYVKTVKDTPKNDLCVSVYELLI